MNAYEAREKLFHKKFREKAKKEAINLLEARSKMCENLEDGRRMWPGGAYNKYKKARIKIVEAARLLQEI